MNSGFAVVDVETTGLYPRSDRVIEIAIVHASDNGDVTAQWSTLVDPKRDLGDAGIHGITQSMLTAVDAPSFTEIAGDTIDRLQGRTIVGHNVRFDISMLESEFRRLNIELREMSGLCTMSIAAGLVPLDEGRSLEACCRSLRINPGNSHTAQDDAMASAAILKLHLEGTGGTALGVALPEPVRFGQDSIPPASDRQAVRPADFAPPIHEPAWLGSLARSMPRTVAPIEANPDACAAYAAMLDRAIEDRALSRAEVAALGDLAADWGLSSVDCQQIHRSYLMSLVAVALADHVITDAEHRDLTMAASLLGFGAETIDSLVAIAATTAPTLERANDMAGQSVCFTGTSEC